MQKRSIEAVEARSVRGVERRGLSDPLETTDVAINHYQLAPGGRLAGLHMHVDQEEVFIVVEGTATFETLAAGRIAVEAGEAIRFGPGEYQSATNVSNEEVALYALGAPKGTEDWRVPIACPECGHDNMRPVLADETPVLACPDCAVESAVACSECGSESKRVILGQDEETPLDVCLDCGAESKAR